MGVTSDAAEVEKVLLPTGYPSVTVVTLVLPSFYLLLTYYCPFVTLLSLFCFLIDTLWLPCRSTLFFPSGPRVPRGQGLGRAHRDWYRPPPSPDSLTRLQQMARQKRVV